jgi:hypothetical protein
MNPLFSAQIIHAMLVLGLFVAYGTLVRRGAIAGKAILGFGAMVTVLAVASAGLAQLPLYRAGLMSLSLYLFHPALMLIVSVFCVIFSYRNQLSEDLATTTLGDTKIIVRFCPPNLIPDADALVVPTTTTLRMIDGLAMYVGMGAGPEPGKEAMPQGPVNIGKVIATGPGKLAVGRIYHVAVGDAFKAVDATKLRRGIETAAQQARKGNAESLAVPVGQLRGLSLQQSVDSIVGGVLKNRKAFAEIVFLVFEPRLKRATAVAVERAVEANEPTVITTPARQSLK